MLVLTELSYFIYYIVSLTFSVVINERQNINIIYDRWVIHLQLAAQNEPPKRYSVN